MPHTILLADDHGIVRSGIKSLAKKHFAFDKVDEATTEKEIIEKVKSFSYDLLCLDINIPGSDFLSLMDWLKNTAPSTRIIIFTTYPEEIYSDRCFQLGAKGFLNKAAEDAEIVSAFKKVLEGGMYFNTSLQKAPLVTHDNKATNPFDDLSSRELEIALLINKGHKLPEICSILNIQYSTANTYKRRIFEKLNVHNAVTLSHLIETFKMKG